MKRQEIIAELKCIIADMLRKEPYQRDWVEALTAFIELLEEQR